MPHRAHLLVQNTNIAPAAQEAQGFTTAHVCLRKPCLICLLASGRSLPADARLAPFRDPATRAEVNHAADLLGVLDRDEITRLTYIIEGFVERKLAAQPQDAAPRPKTQKAVRPRLVISNTKVD